MKKHFFKVFLAASVLTLSMGFVVFKMPFQSLALDQVEQLQQQIEELENLKKLSEDATKPLESELTNLENRIASAQAGITQAQEDAENLAEDIDEREEELAIQFVILSQRLTESYKRSRTASPLLTFLANQDANQLTKDLAYRSSIKAQDNLLITQMEREITNLEADKVALEERQETLAVLQVQLDGQAAFFKTEIAKAKDYQTNLSKQIAELSAQQQAIINARSGTFTTSVGDVALADDFNASIGYKAQAPSNSFAVFSFGAYTHRNGMSQYGARARAEQGQSFEEILKAYYPDTNIKRDYQPTSTITVDGVGTIPFEDQYLHGIYEMPGSWPLEALKAQAIAARTYALRYTNNGQRSICTTESCQVFKNSRKGGAWEQAVNETRGIVLVDGGDNLVSTQYASTHGGFTNTSGWDTTNKSGDGDWATRAWDNISQSPWFYKSWYRNGYSSSGASCGRSHPWLSEEEFADIINAWIVRKNPNGADTNRIQPVTINDCAVGGSGGNPYSLAELRDKANASGGAVTSISSVSTNHNSNGQTATVTVNTNRGTLSIPGSEFKESFNLRAPGYVRIPQSRFAFFNVEHKK